MKDTLPPLPDPLDYCYEWDGPWRTQKFSHSEYNGRRPDRSLALFTADKMRAFALAAVHAEREALRAEVEALRADAERLRWLLRAEGDGGICDWTGGTWCQDWRASNIVRAAIDTARGIK